MEDYVTLIKNFDSKPNCFFGGVFDGHGGGQIAKLASEKIPEIFSEKIKQELSIEKAFQKTYSQFSEMAKEELIGSTALSFFLTGNKMTVANIGDGRLIIADRGHSKQLTTDHNVRDEKELKRLKEHGARVYNHYVIRDLSGVNVTRAFGDLFFKDSGIISEPDIFEIDLQENSVVIMGSDGIWSILTNEKVASLAISGTAEEIAKRILAGIFAKPEEPFDNISMIVIKMKKPGVRIPAGKFLRKSV